ncbi:M48 family metalloprotease [Halorarum halophilum]|uniref:M48 family metalloprotease n=1 Tax=Halorarum halophilum TaxID=2743090 RepID=A0A7D5GA90_9EURY|nr:M48 family metallopeptidase [Halobaculum halophilum]QLG26426.1 M48 family metalloprotease [Halobaculum halophilum]
MDTARSWLRVAMAVVGVLTLAFYVATAYLLTVALRLLWANRPDPVAFVALLVVTGLLSGYLTYRFGTGNALAGLDARELPPHRAPGVYRIRDDLADAMNCPAPSVYVARLGEPNALVLGGRTPATVVDYSLFTLLEPDEFEAVLAHEFAHLEAGHGLAQTLAYSGVRTLVGVVSLALVPLSFVLRGFAAGLALLRGRPSDWQRTTPGRLHVALAQSLTLLLLAMTVFVRAYSRRQEHAADDRAVEVTGRPLALARALRKIERSSEFRFPFEWLSAPPEEEHPLSRLLSTHPSLDERIERLREKATQADHGSDDGGNWTRIRVGD